MAHGSDANHRAQKVLVGSWLSCVTWLFGCADTIAPTTENQRPDDVQAHQLALENGASAYEVRFLRTPPEYSGVMATGLNASGQVLGDLDWPADEGDVGAVWEPGADDEPNLLPYNWPGGRCPSNPAPPDWNRYGRCLAAYSGGINDRGDVAGMVTENVEVTLGAVEDQHDEVRNLLMPVVWIGRVPTRLPIPASTPNHIVFGGASDVNNAGVVLGFEAHERWDDSGAYLGQQSFPTVWISGVPLQLSQELELQAMNDSAIAVGHDRSRTPLTVDVRSGAVRVLTIPPEFSFAEPVDINDKGSVLLRANPTSLVWNPETGSTTPVPLPDPRAMNNHGQVVGAQPSQTYPRRRAALWTESGVVDLNERLPSDAGIILSSAVYINDRGWIVAHAVRVPPPFGSDVTVLLVPPGYRLPWLAGSTWYFTGGPHGSELASLDFAAPGAGGCSYDRRIANYVVAAREGIVRVASQSLVEIDHPDGLRTGYYHLQSDSLEVSVGQRVSAGHPLGHPSCENPRNVAVGATGQIVTPTGVHLHFYFCEIPNDVSAPCLMTADKIPADGHALSSWTIEPGATAREGTLRSGSQLRTATEYHCPDGASEPACAGRRNDLTSDNCCDTPTLVIEPGGDGAGAVLSGSGGIMCPPNCAHAGPAGEVVDLLAEAGPNARFTGWETSCVEGCDNTECSGIQSSCSVTLAGIKKIRATFRPVADLEITGSREGADFRPGRRIVYTLRGRNRGPSAASDFGLTVEVAGASLSSARPSRFCTVTASSASCSFKNVRSGEVVEATFFVTASGSPPTVLARAMSQSTFDPDIGNNSVNM